MYFESIHDDKDETLTGWVDRSPDNRTACFLQGKLHKWRVDTCQWYDAVARNLQKRVKRAREMVNPRGEGPRSMLRKSQPSLFGIYILTSRYQVVQRFSTHYED